MENFYVCGVKISVLNLETACDTIINWIQNRKKAYVCVVPVSTVVGCQSDLQYKNIVNNADMATPDGMPLVWIAKLRGKKSIQRTYGPDLMLKMCEQSGNKGYGHYLYGGSPQVLHLLEIKLKEKFPSLNITGKHSPPFRELSQQENNKIVNEINHSRADILWVGLGSPKQDYWMYQNRSRLDAPVMIAVGAAFDFLAGTKRQAPVWMRRCGLEWFFRLISEPRRLWKRYLIGNTKFIFFLFCDLLKRSKSEAGHA